MNVSKHLFALGLVAAMASPAMAADDIMPPMADSPLSITGNVALTSEYFFRGLSQTNDAPSVQGGFNANYKITDSIEATAGLWAANVDNVTANGGVELDYILGVSGSMDAFSWNAGYTFFTYPGTQDTTAQAPDFQEASIGAGYDFGMLSVGASYAYSPDFLLQSGSGHYINGKITVPLKYVDLSASMGKQYVEKNAVVGVPDYKDYKLAASATVYGLDLELAFIDTSLNSTTYGIAADQNFVLTVSKSF